ncbi:uncharacterized protein HD556DRAFT_1311254 [Suillus plorans]|uniref:Uncharacterized protein n=1 Tax=Suillus plorans TaxID=116603 RepID=A0A9P7AHB9_9AGAM|nr:uncharacterized protein HD556DRAFT_1311254 [Suillus plorans]KAG1789487.1 hypothetical protein HD556DRAFT_1311254 [Suillus plorans]
MGAAAMWAAVMGAAAMWAAAMGAAAMGEAAMGAAAMGAAAVGTIRGTAAGVGVVATWDFCPRRRGGMFKSNVSHKRSNRSKHSIINCDMMQEEQQNIHPGTRAAQHKKFPMHHPVGYMIEDLREDSNPVPMSMVVRLGGFLSKWESGRQVPMHHPIGWPMAMMLIGVDE